MDTIEERTYEDAFLAKHHFSEAVKRLLMVNNWGEFSPGTAFSLFDVHGRQVNREAQTGDFIRIDIPGPGPVSGNGFDWVHVEALQQQNDDDQDLVEMRVRPCPNPINEDEDVAHFLDKQASSTFVVRREANRVLAEEHGRNEVANTSTTRLIDDARNLIVGAAAMLGLSYPQWKLLIKGLLDGKI
ncbi:hypothetical protein ACJVDH_07790 [Pedobacter sp. AW1-32]|uniref:hypothetical protein n=1 Tax=Pedobacter sp. AW1-32 TaxID=3383026 RepID=UPI003FEE3DE9